MREKKPGASADAGAKTRRLSVTDHSPAPSGMPTVFGDEFKGAGERAGLEIWRIEKLKCIKKLNQADPKDDPPNCGQLAHNGRICGGDSYIFLHTKVRVQLCPRPRPRPCPRTCTCTHTQKRPAPYVHRSKRPHGMHDGMHLFVGPHETVCFPTV